MTHFEDSRETAPSDSLENRTDFVRERLGLPPSFELQDIITLVTQQPHQFTLFAASRLIEGLNALSVLAEQELPPRDARLGTLYGVLADLSAQRSSYSTSIAFRNRQFQLSTTSKSQIDVLYEIFSLYSHLDDANKMSQTLNRIEQILPLHASGATVPVQPSLGITTEVAAHPEYLRLYAYKAVVAASIGNHQEEIGCLSTFCYIYSKITDKHIEEAVDALIEACDLQVAHDQFVHLPVLFKLGERTFEKLSKNPEPKARDHEPHLNSEDNELNFYAAFRHFFRHAGLFGEALKASSHLIELARNAGDQLEELALIRPHIQLLRAAGKPDEAIVILSRATAQARKALPEQQLLRAFFEDELCREGIDKSDTRLAKETYKAYHQCVQAALPKELYAALLEEGPFDPRELDRKIKLCAPKQLEYFFNVVTRFFLLQFRYENKINHDAPRALDALEKATQLHQMIPVLGRNGDNFLTPIAASAFLEQGQVETASEVIENYLSNYSSDTPNSSHAFALRIKGSILAMRSDFNGAKDLIEMAIFEFRSIQSPHALGHLSKALIGYAEVLIELHELEEAEHCLLESKEIHQQLGIADSSGALPVYETLLQVYELQGDANSATLCRDKIFQINQFQKLFEPNDEDLSDDE